MITRFYMDRETIQRLINFWRNNFFIEPILILTFIFCFTVGLLYHYKERERIFFIFYFFIGIALLTIVSPLVIYKIFTGRNRAIFAETANTIFELTEFIAFYYFFKKCLQNRKSKKILRIFLISLVIIISAFFIALNLPYYTTETISKHSLFINVIELFFLFIMCLAYFYELFTTVPKINLLQRPSFLIVTSTFFYSALMIPFFMLAHDMLQIEKSTFFILFSFHFILLIIVLITISKAFFCKTPITI
jgi:cbb3-type cytochrome oxidase subunit 3